MDSSVKKKKKKKFPMWTFAFVFWDRGIPDILSGISIIIVDVWGIWNYTLNLRH